MNQSSFASELMKYMLLMTFDSEKEKKTPKIGNMKNQTKGMKFVSLFFAFTSRTATAWTDIQYSWLYVWEKKLNLDSISCHMCTSFGTEKRKMRDTDKDIIIFEECKGLGFLCFCLNHNHNVHISIQSFMPYATVSFNFNLCQWLNRIHGLTAVLSRICRK